MTARDENVPQKENSRCFKLHRPHSNSLICQMLAIFSGDEFLSDYFRLSSQKEKESRCLVYTSSIKREIRPFQVVVVQ